MVTVNYRPLADILYQLTDSHTKIAAFNYVRYQGRMPHLDTFYVD
jgi:hypothetical protein